jgi:hypothetical protein
VSTPLERDFDDLAAYLRRLIGLLEEADDRYWVIYLRRGLREVEEHRLSGATHVLGCYGGEDTFSDLVIGKRWALDEPLRYRNLNARLVALRTETFEAANVIASRRNW